MKVKIIKIGNSKGLRLSKTILEKYKIEDSVELVLEQNHIELRPISSSRAGWDKAFKKMNDLGDDELLIADIFEEEQMDEWK